MDLDSMPSGPIKYSNKIMQLIDGYPEEWDGKASQNSVKDNINSFAENKFPEELLCLLIAQFGNVVIEDTSITVIADIYAESMEQDIECGIVILAKMVEGIRWQHTESPEPDALPITTDIYDSDFGILLKLAIDIHQNKKEKLEELSGLCKYVAIESDDIAVPDLNCDSPSLDSVEEVMSRVLSAVNKCLEAKLIKNIDQLKEVTTYAMALARVYDGSQSGVIDCAKSYKSLKFFYDLALRTGRVSSGNSIRLWIDVKSLDELDDEVLNQVIAMIAINPQDIDGVIRFLVENGAFDKSATRRDVEGVINRT